MLGLPLLLPLLLPPARMHLSLDFAPPRRALVRPCHCPPISIRPWLDADQLIIMRQNLSRPRLVGLRPIIFVRGAERLHSPEVGNARLSAEAKGAPENLRRRVNVDVRVIVRQAALVAVPQS